jgi:hypothetical protein
MQSAPACCWLAGRSCSSISSLALAPSPPLPQLPALPSPSPPLLPLLPAPRYTQPEDIPSGHTRLRVSGVGGSGARFSTRSGPEVQSPETRPSVRYMACMQSHPAAAGRGEGRHMSVIFKLGSALLGGCIALPLSSHPPLNVSSPYACCAAAVVVPLRAALCTGLTGSRSREPPPRLPASLPAG